MEKLDTRKRALLLLISYVIILFTPKFMNKKDKSKTTYNNTYNASDDYHYATYNNHNIYIIPDNVKYDDSNPDDIYIIDSRYDNNPDIKIRNSSKIKRLKDIREILKVLVELEREYPTEWDRTIKSMEIEWLVHNILYDYQIEPSRTNDVDLDNNDEEKYQSYLNILRELITNIDTDLSYSKKIKLK